jgi:transcriptional regulator of acetoin/glycerol metabolism
LQAPVEAPKATTVAEVLATQSENSLLEAEKRAIIDALTKTHGNKKQAAQLLGIHRPTLYAKMKRHGLMGPEEA